MFPITYIFTEKPEEKLVKQITSNSITRQIYVPNTNQRKDPDVERMSNICYYYYGTKYRNLLVTKFSTASIASYAGLLADGQFNTLMIKDADGYELSKVLSSKIIEMNAFQKYTHETKKFFELLNIHLSNSVFTDLLAVDLEVKDKKLSNFKTSHELVKSLIQDNFTV